MKNDTTDKQIKALEKRIKSLEKDDKKIVEILSIIYYRILGKN